MGLNRSLRVFHRAKIKLAKRVKKLTEGSASLPRPPGIDYVVTQLRKSTEMDNPLERLITNKFCSGSTFDVENKLKIKKIITWLIFVKCVQI